MDEFTPRAAAQGEGFFGFLSSVDPRYAATAIARMNLRHRFIVQKFAKDIADSRVLDLAAHDGRWCYAFAAAGARAVLGIEGRTELVEKFSAFPANPFKDRVRLLPGDIFDWCRRLVAEKQRFDVVGVLGIIYHITDHYGLLNLVGQMQPKLVIIDGAFLDVPDHVVQLKLDDTDNKLHSTAQSPGQKKAVVGTLSRRALEMMADSIGFSTEWLDWNEIPERERQGVQDYYGKGPRKRFTCALRPIAARA